jgi:uncharacterized membrane protein
VQCVRIFEYRPNCSLNPQSAAIFFAVVAATSLLVAAYFVTLGLWPVLPFAGLELTALGAVLLHSLRRGRWHEIVSVSDGRVEIDIFTGRTRRKIGFPRAWTQVELRRAPISGHPSHLFIGSQGRFVEIGRHLTEDERREQEKKLKRAIGGMGQSPEFERVGE